MNLWNSRYDNIIVRNKSKWPYLVAIGIGYFLHSCTSSAHHEQKVDVFPMTAPHISLVEVQVDTNKDGKSDGVLYQLNGIEGKFYDLVGAFPDFTVQKALNLNATRPLTQDMVIDPSKAAKPDPKDKGVLEDRLKMQIEFEPIAQSKGIERSVGYHYVRPTGL